MKKHIWLLVLSALIATACATKPPTEDGGYEVDSDISEVDDDADFGESTKAKPSKPVKQDTMTGARPQKSLDPKYRALSQALRSNNERALVGEASKILGANGNDPVALNAIAMFQFRQGRLGAARILMDKAFEKNPNSASLLNNLALLQMAEGDMPTALTTLKKAYRIDDRNPEILGNLGSLYVRGGDYVRALPLLEQAYRANRANAAIATNYAIALRATKSYDKAADVYEALIKQNSRDVNAHLNYAILLIDFMSKPKEGLQMAMKVKFLETESKDVLDRANALEKKARAEIK